jgi:hypothetical protein
MPVADKQQVHAEISIYAIFVKGLHNHLVFPCRSQPRSSADQGFIGGAASPMGVMLECVKVSGQSL